MVPATVLLNGRVCGPQGLSRVSNLFMGFLFDYLVLQCDELDSQLVPWDLFGLIFTTLFLKPVV